MAKPCSVCGHADRASVEIGLANGIALRVLGLRYGLDPTQLGRHRTTHMGKDLVGRLKMRAARSDEELANIREAESRSLVDNLILQRNRLYRNSDAAFAIGDLAGERAALDSAGKSTERLAKLLGEMGISSVTINNTQLNLTQLPAWHQIRTALVRELRPLGIDAIQAGARAIAAAEAAIAQPSEPMREPLLIEAISHD
jgi:hypothetical protein